MHTNIRTKVIPKLKGLPLAQSLKLLLWPCWGQQHSEQSHDSHCMCRTVLQDQEHVCCPLAFTYRDFGIYPHPVASWCAMKCHLPSPGDPACGARRSLQLWQGSSCWQTSVSLLGWIPIAARAHKQHKLTQVCNSRLSVLDGLTVSRQRSDPLFRGIVLLTVIVYTISTSMRDT